MIRKAITLFLGMAAVLALAITGVGAARAQSGGTGNDTAYDRFINRVAELLGETPAHLESALTRASTEQVDRAVEDGDLTQEQADRIKERIAETGRPFPIFGGLRGGFGPHGDPHGGVFGEVTAVSGSTITVETRDGNKTVRLTGDTEIRDEGEEAEVSAITVGDTVKIIGEANDAGVVTAEAVLIGEPGRRGFPGGRGHHHGPWGDRAPNGETPADGSGVDANAQ